MSAVDGWEGTGEVTSTTVTCIRGDGHSWSDADGVAIQVAVNITQSEEARADRLSGACRRSKPPPTSYDVPEVALISTLHLSERFVSVSGQNSERNGLHEFTLSEDV
jgi:hypothetical protein